MTYTPEPIDTSKVHLPAEVEALTELLAKHSHDVYARKRIAMGWSHGPRRDDFTRQNPTLIQYEELPDSEKDQNRESVQEMMRAVFTLGYRLERSDRSEDAGSVDRSPLAFERCRELCESFLNAGRPFQAFDLLRQWLRTWPDDPLLRLLRARTLTEMKMPGRAKDELKKLVEEGHDDEEVLGYLARVYKDLWSLEPEDKDGQDCLKRAFETYQEVYQRSKGANYWTGINAATTALLRNKIRAARQLARQVRTTCIEELHLLRRRTDDAYWVLATLGEASLILGEWEPALEYYAQAAACVGRRYRRMSSTRRNARLIAQCLGCDWNMLGDLMPLPAVMVFVGHMLDRPNRKLPRFPTQLAQPLQKEIAARLKKHNVEFGYGSAACGADILFHEQVLERDGEIHVVLPCNRATFRKESVDVRPRAKWGQRYEAVLRRASLVREVSSDRPEAWEESYAYTNKVLFGLASLHARQLDTKLVPMAAWDGHPGDGFGGTYTVVQSWKKKSGLDMEVIDMGALLHDKCPAIWLANEKRRRPAPPPRKRGATIRSFLFADVVNYTMLHEEQIPLFMKHFMGGVARLCKECTRPPEVKNTWGDALYFVFEELEDAGLFSLNLCSFVEETSWEHKELPGSLSIRVSLHAGPVHALKDPVIEKRTFTGAHVSRAARIEPVTPPGQVFCSEAFAALVAAGGIQSFGCEYVGETPLAKGYGSLPMYHVHRVRMKKRRSRHRRRSSK